MTGGTIKVVDANKMQCQMTADELHQLLIDGRSGQWSDVLLDSGGVLTGALIAGLILALTWKRQRA